MSISSKNETTYFKINKNYLMVKKGYAKIFNYAYLLPSLQNFPVFPSGHKHR